MRKLILFFQPVAKYVLIIWLLLILIFSITPNLPTINVNVRWLLFRFDYIIHFLEYATLSVLAILTFIPYSFRSMMARFCLVLLTLIVFAIINELLHLIIPGRTFEPNDILSNILGIASGIFFIGILYRIAFRIPKKA